MERTRIALALHAATTEEMLRALEAQAGAADLVELRIDGMTECDLPRLLRERPCPVIVTCRAAWEGGAFHGDEAERAGLLLEAAALGAEHIDWELAAPTPPPASGSLGATRVIRSAHDFAGMPDMAALYRGCVAAGADIAKMVGFAHDALDALAALRTLRAADTPTIALAMGEAGLVSRILALRYRAYLTFVSPNDRAGTAPGQISADALREVYCGDRITPATRCLGVLCAGGVEALAPALASMNRRIREAGVDATAVPLVCGGAADADAVIAAYAAFGFDGFAAVGPVAPTGGDVQLHGGAVPGGGDALRRLAEAAVARA